MIEMYLLSTLLEYFSHALSSLSVPILADFLEALIIGLFDKKDATGSAAMLSEVANIVYMYYASVFKTQ